jgi:DNA-binding XRE family transcriptional regulator
VTEPRPVSPLTLAAREAKLPRPWLAVVDGDMLRKLRCNLGLTQKALADRAEVGRQTVNKLENVPSARCLPRVAARLAMALNEDQTIIVRELVSIAPKDRSQRPSTGA